MNDSKVSPAFDLEKRMGDLVFEYGKSSEDGNYYLELGEIKELVRRLAAEVRADERKSKWIPIEEQLPEIGRIVLAFHGGLSWLAHVDKSDRWYSSLGNVFLPQVTHWQPLPSPPEQGTGQ